MQPYRLFLPHQKQKKNELTVFFTHQLKSYILKIVILDGFALNPGDLSWKNMKKMGDCQIYDRTKPKDVFDRIHDAEVIVTNKVVIDKALIDRLPDLKYIGVTATGYNVIDVQAASARNIL